MKPIHSIPHTKPLSALFLRYPILCLSFRTHVPIVQSKFVRQEPFQTDDLRAFLQVQEEEGEAVVEGWSEGVVVDQLYQPTESPASATEVARYQAR